MGTGKAKTISRRVSAASYFAPGGEERGGRRENPRRDGEEDERLYPSQVSSLLFTFSPFPTFSSPFFRKGAGMMMKRRGAMKTKKRREAGKEQEKMESLESDGREKLTLFLPVSSVFSLPSFHFVRNGPAVPGNASVRWQADRGRRCFCPRSGFRKVG